MVYWVSTGDRGENPGLIKLFHPEDVEDAILSEVRHSDRRPFLREVRSHH